MEWSTLILVSVMLVSSVIYIIFLATIIRFRKQDPFSSSFFSLSLPLGIADLGSLLNSYLTSKLPGWGFFLAQTLHSWPTVAGLGFNIAVFFIFWQKSAVVLLAVNRLTAVARPLRYNAMWHKWIVPSMVCQVLIGFVVSISLMLYTSPQSLYYGCTNGTNYCFIMFRDKSTEISYFKLVSIAQLFFALLCGLCYLFMLVIVVRRGRNNGGYQIRVIERNLAFCGFCTFVTMAAYVGVAVAFGRAEDRVQLLVLWYFVGDLFAYINPFLLLCCSTEVRKRFIQTLFCQRERPIVHSSVSFVRSEATPATELMEMEHLQKTTTV